MFSQLQDSKRGSGETWAAVCFCFRKNSTCPESSLNLGSISKCTFIHFRQYKLTVGFTLLRRPAVFFQLRRPSPRTQSASTVWCPGLTATGRPAAPAPTWRRCWRASAGARLKPCGAASTVTDTSWTPPTRIQGTRVNSGRGDRVMSEEEAEPRKDKEEQPGGNGRTPTGSRNTQHVAAAVTVQTQSSALGDWTSNTGGETFESCEITTCHAAHGCRGRCCSVKVTYCRFNLHKCQSSVFVWLRLFVLLLNFLAPPHM